MTTVAIPLYDGVDILDVAGPFEMLDWAGFEVDLLAERVGRITCRSGGVNRVHRRNGAPVFHVERTFADAPQYDILWVPGGDLDALVALMDQSPRTYLDFLVAQSRGARMTCSVCEGSILLAEARLLDGYRATTHWKFVACFARWPAVEIATDNPRYVHDRDRLTGSGISSGLDEALKLIELETDAETAREVQRITQYFPDPPVTGVLPPPGACPLPPHRHTTPA